MISGWLGAPHCSTALHYVHVPLTAHPSAPPRCSAADGWLTLSLHYTGKEVPLKGIATKADSRVKICAVVGEMAPYLLLITARLTLFFWPACCSWTVPAGCSSQVPHRPHAE